MTDEVEVIIVDDCSTDRTVNFIRMCIMRNLTKNITLIVNPKNKGVSYARNFGLKHAKGEYIAFVDGDDYVSKNYISILLLSLRPRFDYFILSWQKTNGEKFYCRSLPNWNKTVWSRVIKKSIITVMFDESLSWGEDAKFLNDNITRKNRCGFIDETMYFYRWKRPNSITSAKLGR